MDSYAHLILEAEKNLQKDAFVTTASSDGKDTYTVCTTENEVWTPEKDSREFVNHPNHYNTGKIEVIDFIEDQKLGFHLGNSVKYICRAGKKDPSKLKEDLEKAIWYIERYIKSIEEN